MNTDVKIRSSSDEHLDFITSVDLKDEGITNDIPGRGDFDEHRRHIQGMLDRDAAAWVIAITDVSRPTGLIMCRFRNLAAEDAAEENQFLLRYLPRRIFPASGRFTEIYQLWIDPAFRRRGLASMLKRHVELESRARGIAQIYTHTEKSNSHVVRMNLNLGYRIVREGTMWDEIERVSLVKDLQVPLKDAASEPRFA